MISGEVPQEYLGETKLEIQLQKKMDINKPIIGDIQEIYLLL